MNRKLSMITAALILCGCLMGEDDDRKNPNAGPLPDVRTAGLAPSVFTWDGELSTLSTLPATVSELGFDPNDTAVFIPYRVNVPQYRYYYYMERYVYVPEGKKIIPDDSIFYTIPKGTVFFRNVFVNEIFGAPSSKKLVELQMQVRVTDSTWGRAFYSYYGPGVSDGQLVTDQVFPHVDITIQGAGALGYSLEETVPAAPADSINLDFYKLAMQCNDCHFDNSPNGFITQQLNVDNQLDELAAKNIITHNPVKSMNPAVNMVKWYPMSDPGATLQQRALSYLAANCGHCHNNLEDRHLSDMASEYYYFRTSPVLTYLGGIEPSIIAGKPDSSLALTRLIEGSMPISDHDKVPDIEGIKMLWEWVNSLTTPPGTAPFPGITLEQQ